MRFKYFNSLSTLKDMFAIANIKGSQYKISEGDKMKVAKISDKEGEKVIFYDVLLISKNDNVTVGAPLIDGAAIETKVVSHGRGDKIRVVKHKKRKRYIRTQGHRQDYTEVEIVKIVESGAKKPVEKEPVEKAAPVKKKAPASSVKTPSAPNKQAIEFEPPQD